MEVAKAPEAHHNGKDVMEDKHSLVQSCMVDSMRKVDIRWKAAVISIVQMYWSIARGGSWRHAISRVADWVFAGSEM